MKVPRGNLIFPNSGTSTKPTISLHGNARRYLCQKPTSLTVRSANASASTT